MGEDSGEGEIATPRLVGARNDKKEGGRKDILLKPFLWYS
jgi:hypothetical protein